MADEKTTTNINFRLSPELLAAIDERVADVNAHGDGKLSRNEWLDKCVRWSLRNLPYGASGPEVRETAASAPVEISGTYAMRMSAIDERRLRD